MEVGGAATGAVIGRIAGVGARATLGATGLGLAVGLVGDVVFGVGYNLVREDLRRRRLRAETTNPLKAC
jgi:hypothetical protein